MSKQSGLTWIFLLIVIFAIVFGQVTSAEAQKVHALLIILGNDRDIRASVEKNESSMQTLLRQVSENCEVRMTVMKSTEETTGTVHEKTLTNGNVTAQSSPQQLGIIKANQVVQWVQDLRSNGEDTILIYYSGHGSMDAVGTHILNFDPEVTNDFVTRDGLQNRLKQKRSRLKMLITDTCSNRVQSPPLIARVYAKVQSRERRYTKNLFLEHSGLLDITAASDGQYAWGNDEIGGYFTVSLIGSFTAETDANQDRFLSWKEVFDVTRSKTQKLFRETTFLSHNQRKLDEIRQTTQTPTIHTLPERLTLPPRQRPTQFTPSPQIPKTITGKDGAKMALIPAGEFQMGSNDNDADSDEQPVHTVYMNAFYMDKYEVTNAQYAAFLNAKGKHAEYGRVWYDLKKFGTIKHVRGRYRVKEGYGDHPVTYVSWYGAMAYAQWAGKRLPTEAEWEKAARGGLIRKTYPWGNSIDSSKANYNHHISQTTQIGEYSPNDYDLYDMAGNVWEWCLDGYDSDFYRNFPRRNPIAGEVHIASVINNFMNIRTPRILRGGSYASPGGYVRVANRGRDTPTSTNGIYGFRCVRSVTP